MSVEKTTPGKLHRVGETYAVIPSSTTAILKNPDAYVILGYLLDQSPNWIVRRSQIMKRWGFGRTRYDNAVRELKQLGLYWVEITRKEQGRIKERIICVSATPVNTGSEPKDGNRTSRLESEGDQVNTPSTPKGGKPTTRDIQQDGESDHLTTNNKNITTDRERAPAKKSVVHSKTSLDPDTPLSDENFNAASQYFTSKGKPLLNPLDEWQKFIAYYVSQGEKRENWDAAWQSWYMKSVEFDRTAHSDSLRRPLADDMNDRSWAA